MEARTEPSFVQFLRLLGFPSHDDATSKPIVSPDLFLLPNRDAFQKVRIQIQTFKLYFLMSIGTLQIIHFLYQTYDKEKCSNELRDCWPIIEKRQEAEFRRNVFAWYKDLQV